MEKGLKAGRMGRWFNSSLFLSYPNLTGEKILILGIIIPCWKTEKGVFKTEMQPTPKHKYIPMGFYCQNPEMSFIMFTRQPASQPGSLALRLHFPFFVSWLTKSFLHLHFAYPLYRATTPMLNLGYWDMQFIFWNEGSIFVIYPWKISNIYKRDDVTISPIPSSVFSN